MHSQHRKRITMHEISSLLFLVSASVVKRLAATWGSLMCFTKSTASWFFMTYVNIVQQRKFSSPQSVCSLSGTILNAAQEYALHILISK